jgi:hypothetical protein
MVSALISFSRDSGLLRVQRSSTQIPLGFRMAPSFMGSQSLPFWARQCEDEPSELHARF